MSILEDRFTKMRAKLKDILNQQKHVCITCDVWSSRAQSYLGATVHFINQNYERESYVLGFKQLPTHQTYFELSQELKKMFRAFDIPTEKIANIVTDGGSAFCKMFNVFGSRTDAIVSDIDTNCEDMDEDGEIHMQGEDGELYSSEILSFESVESTNASSDFESYFTETIPDVHFRNEMPPQC